MRISRGVWYMIFATSLIAVMQAMVKALPNIPPEEIVFFRALLSLTLCIIVMKKENISFKGNNYPLLVMRGIVGTFSLLTFFYTLQNIPLASAVTIGNLSPLFLSIFAVVFLKERIHPLAFIALIISFMGVFLIKGFDPRVTAGEILLAISSAILAAIAHFTVRLLRDEHPISVLFYFSLVIIPVLLPFVLINWKSPTPYEWLMILIIGLVAHFSQLFLTKALKSEEISRINGIYYLGIAIAMAIGFFIFEETFNIQSVIGMLLIVCGVLVTIFIKKS